MKVQALEHSKHSTMETMENTTDSMGDMPMPDPDPMPGMDMMMMMPMWLWSGVGDSAMGEVPLSFLFKRMTS
jgi:hypothetical protein